VLFVALFIASIFLVSSPNPGQPTAKIYSYYLNHKTQLNVDCLLTYLAVIAGVWFFASLWRYFRSFGGTEVQTAVGLIGVVFFASSGVIGAGLNFAAADHTGALGAGNGWNC
jgi:hypothetical protein